MKLVLLAIVLLGLSGCASKHLMKDCETLGDSGYSMCKRPNGIFHD